MKPVQLSSACAICCTLLALSFATPAAAALLAYEGFDYADPVGTSIADLNGGTGWLTAYSSPNNATVGLGDNLGYPGIASIGKGLDFNGGNGNMGNGRDWGDSSVSPADGTYWYSFLAQQDLNGRGTFIIFKSSTSGDGQNGFGIRIDNNSGSPQFKAWSPIQAAGANIDFSGGYGLTYFVLGKTVINSAGSSENSIWVYQDPSAIPTTEPTTPMSTIVSGWSGNAETARTTISGRAFSNNTGLNYDEVRIGTSFFDVVPEPSLSALLVVGLGLVAGRRLRR